MSKIRYYKMDHDTWGHRYFKVEDEKDVLHVVLRGRNRNQTGFNAGLYFIKNTSFTSNYGHKVWMEILSPCTKEEFQVALDAIIHKFKLNQMKRVVIKSAKNAVGNIEIEIEKNVPLPNKYKKAVRNKKLSKYPFKKMKKGDSFADTGENLKKLQRTLSGAACYFKKTCKPKWEFTTAIDADKNQVRVWRIK